MNLDAAITRIHKSFAEMDELYQRPVFNEIAIVSLAPGNLKPDLHFYEGPRESVFMDTLLEDSIALRREVADVAQSEGGQFGFTREGDGANIDAYICLGPMVFLLCNNTELSMEAVTKDSLWLGAQGAFLNASQFFATDPLVL